MAKTKLNITVSDEVLWMLTDVRDTLGIRPSEFIDRVLKKYGDIYLEEAREALGPKPTLETWRKEAAAELNAFEAIADHSESDE